MSKIHIYIFTHRKIAHLTHNIYPIQSSPIEMGLAIDDLFKLNHTIRNCVFIMWLCQFDVAFSIGRDDSVVTFLDRRTQKNAFARRVNCPIIIIIIIIAHHLYNVHTKQMQMMSSRPPCVQCRVDVHRQTQRDPQRSDWLHIEMFKHTHFLYSQGRRWWLCMCMSWF